MATKEMKQCKKIVQCEKCPWRKSTNPLEIPGGYDEHKHRALTSTTQGEGKFAPIGNMMACHESSADEPFPCAGWLENQLGVGNNLGLRYAALCGQVPAYQTSGEQHERLKDTFPTAAHRRAYKAKLTRQAKAKLP